MPNHLFGFWFSGILSYHDQGQWFFSPLGITGANYGDLRNSRMEIDYIL